MENILLGLGLLVAILLSIVIYCNIGMQYGKLVWRLLKINDIRLEATKRHYRNLYDRLSLDISFKWYFLFFFPLKTFDAIYERSYRKISEACLSVARKSFGKVSCLKDVPHAVCAKQKYRYFTSNEEVAVYEPHLLGFYFFNHKKGFFFTCAIMWPFLIVNNIIFSTICGIVIGYNILLRMYWQSPLPDWFKALPNRAMLSITSPSRKCVKID